jgi:KaiC/GvpD/RAD55 family RecA-like ATPase
MPDNRESLEIYPIGVEGLTKILYPSGISGFEKPSLEKPKSVLITGAPGAGKTILATQMLFEMAKQGARCSFVTTRDNADIIKNIALTFGFCTECYVKNNDDGNVSLNENIIKYIELLDSFKFPTIRIREVPSNTYLNLFEPDNNIVQDELNGKPEVLFIDSLNIAYFHLYEKRDQIKEMFDRIINPPNTLSIILLEDYKEFGTAQTRELTDDCEFLADIVMDLTYEKGYRYLEVKKKHYGPHIGGKHHFNICRKHHHLSNIETKAPSGIIVYPSISRFLKESQIDPYCEKNKVHTGITHLDSMLTYMPGKYDAITGESIEKNACIVISGKRGNHKLSFGLNILIGGLWEIVPREKGSIEKKIISSNKDVLLISLDEPANIPEDKLRPGQPQIALAYNTHDKLMRKSFFKKEGLDNGNWIRWRIHDDHPNKHPRKEAEAKDCEICCIFDKIISHEQTGRNNHKSVFLNKWCAYTGEFKGKYDINNIDENDITGCSSLIVASYRPGYITPDEFLYSISRLVEFEESEERYYEKIVFPNDIFKTQIPSIEGNVSEKIFCLLVNAEIIKKSTEAENKYYLNTQYGPEEVWETLDKYVKEREAIISILSDYKQKKTRFSRVLFHSTALLQNRFPSLSKEPLFLTALADFFKSKGIMSIFINNTDTGYDEKISHGILSSADCIIELGDITKKDLAGCERPNYSWSKLSIANAKAKSYMQTPHYISVQPINGRNELIMSDKISADITDGSPSNSISKPLRIVDLLIKPFKRSRVAAFKNA